MPTTKVATAVYTLAQRPRDGGVVMSDLAYLAKYSRKKTLQRMARTTKNGNEIYDLSYRKGISWTEESQSDVSVTQLRVAVLDAPVRFIFPRGTRLEDRKTFILEAAANLVALSDDIANGLQESATTVSIPNGTQDA